MIKKLYLNKKFIEGIDKVNKVVFFNGKKIVYVNNFRDRKRICDKLYQKFKLSNFKFENQSYGEITNEIFKFVNQCDLPDNIYNNEVLEIVDKYYCQPIHRNFKF